MMLLTHGLGAGDTVSDLPFNFNTIQEWLGITPGVTPSGVVAFITPCPWYQSGSTGACKFPSTMAVAAAAAGVLALILIGGH
jgi:hypothetical protein